MMHSEQRMLEGGGRNLMLCFALTDLSKRSLDANVTTSNVDVLQYPGDR